MQALRGDSQLAHDDHRHHSGVEREMQRLLSERTDLPAGVALEEDRRLWVELRPGPIPGSDDVLIRVEAQLDASSPAVGHEVRDVVLPEESFVLVVVREDRAIPARPETRLMTGDKVLAITSADREAELRSVLIGE